MNETCFATVPVLARCCDDVARETRFELPGSWEGVSYALVEYCSPRDSPLRCESEHTKLGYLVRCANDIDMTQDKSISRLMRFIRSVPSHFVVILWSSIPCAGGPMVLSATNMGREGFLRQLDRHYELRQHLFYNFVKLAQAVMLRRGFIAIGVASLVSMLGAADCW